MGDTRFRSVEKGQARELIGIRADRAGDSKCLVPRGDKWRPAARAPGVQALGMAEVRRCCPVW